MALTIQWKLPAWCNHCVLPFLSFSRAGVCFGTITTGGKNDGTTVSPFCIPSRGNFCILHPLQLQARTAVGHRNRKKTSPTKKSPHAGKHEREDVDGIANTTRSLRPESTVFGATPERVNGRAPDAPFYAKLHSPAKMHCLRRSLKVASCAPAISPI